MKSRRPLAPMLLTAIAVHAARTSSTVFDDLITGWSADVAPFQSFFQHEHFGKAWKQIRADLKKQLKRNRVRSSSSSSVPEFGRSPSCSPFIA